MFGHDKAGFPGKRALPYRALNSTPFFLSRLTIMDYPAHKVNWVNELQQNAAIMTA
jgi:hypothetical protein